MSVGKGQKYSIFNLMYMFKFYINKNNYFVRISRIP